MTQEKESIADLFIALHRTRAELLGSAKKVRTALANLSEAGDAMSRAKRRLIELTNKIGPLLHADAAGVLGSAKAAEAELDKAYELTERQLNDLSIAVAQAAE